MLFPCLFFQFISCLSIVFFVFLSPLVSSYTTLIYNCGRCDSLCSETFSFVSSISSLSKQGRHMYAQSSKDHMLL
jgi:hypothetical protein